MFPSPCCRVPVFSRPCCRVHMFSRPSYRFHASQPLLQVPYVFFFALVAGSICFAALIGCSTHFPTFVTGSMFCHPYYRLLMFSRPCCRFKIFFHSHCRLPMFSRPYGSFHNSPPPPPQIVIVGFTWHVDVAAGCMFCSPINQFVNSSRQCYR